MSKEQVSIRCPNCKNIVTAKRERISESPEVYSFHCYYCHHDWEEPNPEWRKKKMTGIEQLKKLLRDDPEARGYWYGIVEARIASSLNLIEAAAKPEPERKKSYKIEGSNSKVIRDIKYWVDEKILFITFWSNAQYLYFNIPEHIIEGIFTADSYGTYFNTFIKGKFPTAKLELRNP